jgi:hypothetical protein
VPPASTESPAPPLSAPLSPPRAQPRHRRPRGRRPRHHCRGVVVIRALSSPRLIVAFTRVCVGTAVVRAPVVHSAVVHAAIVRGVVVSRVVALSSGDTKVGWASVV